MVPLSLAVVPPFAAGLVLLQLLWPRSRPPRADLLLKLVLAAGVAFGASSCTFFLGLVLFGRITEDLVWMEVFVYLGLTLAGVLSIRRARAAQPLTPEPEPLRPTTGRAIVGLFCSVVVLGALFVFLALVWHNPHGGIDAVSIWNLRARFLFRAGEQWPETFAINACHPDYPLLLPAGVARLWGYVGETTLVPQVVAVLFTLGSAALLGAALDALRSRCQALLGVMLLMGTPLFLVVGSAQVADVPLAFYFLAATALFCLHDQVAAGDRGLAALAGVMTGFACWTKNEGWLFAVMTLAARALLAQRLTGWRHLLREMRAFALGFAPAALVVLAFKVRFVPPNDLVAGQSVQATLARLADLGRYREIAMTYAREASRIGYHLVLVLAVYAVLAGRTTHRFVERLGMLHAWLVVGLMLVGYAFVYVVTPYDLTYHLHTSLGRLFMQLWPTALLAFFLTTATPEEGLGGRRSVAICPEAHVY